MKYYAGIGSRKTPPRVLGQMTQIARWFQSKEYVLRSGAAAGADTAFEAGAGNMKEIFLAKDAMGDKGGPALEMAKKFHPKWNACGPTAKLLHARNVFQILGRNYSTPVDLVICWTQDGCTSDRTRSIRTGGTGTAISIASHKGIPVFNLQSHKSRMELLDYMGLKHLL